MPGRTATLSFRLFLAMALGGLLLAAGGGPLLAQTGTGPGQADGTAGGTAEATAEVATNGDTGGQTGEQTGAEIAAAPGDRAPEARLGPGPYEPAPLTEDLEAEVLAEAALTPEIMLLEPPLTDADYGIFIAQYNEILFGTGRLNFREFARGMGITLRRLNYLTAKITMPLGEPNRRAGRVNELGLGVMMDRGERELFLKHEAKLTELTEAMKRAISR
ncbi:MAG: hypothetical protein LBJ61_05525 [Deltaproteobacteria bacterium]|nr:hypothetical protein [Deltaproteobacteria bacterium]